MKFKEGDSILVKKLYVHPVPTNKEVKLLLDLFDDNTTTKVALLMMIAQGPRPAELCRMTWNKFWINDEKDRILKFRHYVYKAGSRKTNRNTRFYFKEVEKPIMSKMLSDQLLTYRKIYSKIPGNKLFPWTTPDGLQRQISKVRKLHANGKLGSQYDFLQDKLTEVLVGPDPFTQYRVSMYSLRRFSLTFHYWVTFDKDPWKVIEFTGHKNPETLLEHYVKPYHAIGLTPEMIKKKISIDQFINHRGKCQIPLSEFTEEEVPRFLPVGQRTISDFYV